MKTLSLKQPWAELVVSGKKLREDYKGKGKNKATLEHIENRPCFEK